MAKTKSPRVHKLERLTHDKLKSFDRARTIVIATLSPLEVHGPHLPLGQDIFEGYALAERTAQLLTDKLPDWRVVLLPPAPVAADGVPSLGTVAFPAPLVRDVAVGLLAPFAKAGFARLAYSSFHGGPRHVCALEEAAATLAARHGVPAVSLFSAVLGRVMEGGVFLDALADRPERKIDLEQLKQDHHAGFVETSLALALWPELVDEGWRNLPPSVSDPHTANKDTNDSFLFGYAKNESLRQRFKRNAATVGAIVRALRHFRANTYHGYPAMASAAQGKALYEHLARVCLDAALEFVARGADFDGHSPLWKYRHVFLNATANKVADDWLGVNGA